MTNPQKIEGGEKTTTIKLWHKDGVVFDSNDKKTKSRVYVDGQLSNTQGKYQHLVVVIIEKEINL